jgi:hypothetical protein
LPDWLLAILSIMLGVVFWFLFEWVASLKTESTQIVRGTEAEAEA